MKPFFASVDAWCGISNDLPFKRQESTKIISVLFGLQLLVTKDQEDFL